MAGVKGKSGGPRKNAGGARLGAGRKKKVIPQESANQGRSTAAGGVSVTLEPQPHGGSLKRKKAGEDLPAIVETRDPLEFLLDVMQGRVDAKMVQVRAAIAAAQYKHAKKGDGGKKDEQADKAKKAASKFAPSAPPKLVVNNGK